MFLRNRSLLLLALAVASISGCATTASKKPVSVRSDNLAASKHFDQSTISTKADIPSDVLEFHNTPFVDASEWEKTVRQVSFPDSDANTGTEIASQVGAETVSNLDLPKDSTPARLPKPKKLDDRAVSEFDLDSDYFSDPNANAGIEFDEYGEPVQQRPSLSIADAVRIALSDNKSIMVLGYVPQEEGTLTDLERAAFDPVLQANIRGGKYDRQLANFIQSGGVIPTNEQQTDLVGAPDRNILSISKLLESGGIVELGIGTDYLFQDPPGAFVIQNPAWYSALNFRWIQPLMRGAGKDVTTAPIRIAQAGRDQSAHQFQARVNSILRDVRLAYWDWKLAARIYEVRTQAVATALETLESEQEALRLGEGTAPNVAQARDQWHRFRIAEANARNDFIQARIELTRLMGVAANQATYDNAIDEPNVGVYLEREVGDATALLRPEVLAMRSQIRAAEIAVRVACNNMRPDLDLRFDYAITGLEDRLDDAFDTTFDARFNDWLVQLDYRRAVGLRAEYAGLRRARLRLARARAEQDQVEHNIVSEVAASWENVQLQRETLQVQRERVQTAQEFVEGRDELYREGEGTLDQKVRAEQSLVDAQLAELASEIALQQAIVQWEFATGQQNQVQFCE